jgi:phage gp36-like protein
MYASVDQFILRFGLQESLELTSLEDPCSSSINTAQLSAALMDASSLIDGYIQARVTLPLVPAAMPISLVWACCDIARYHLDRNRTREEVRLRYEDRIAWLKDVSKGLVNLGFDTQVPPRSATAAPDLVYSAGRERIFTGDLLNQYAAETEAQNTGGWA